jgi:nicotinamide-nucleotide amidase
MKAEIMAVGTEILLGEIVDTNSAYIASHLPALGIDVYFKHTVGDNLQRITDVMRRALENSDVLITSGGLGPTEDDLTREAICAVFNEVPQIDPDLETWLRGVFSSRGNAMPERNLKQAWLIPSARAIPNPRGTAPGWWAEKDGKIIVSMPGPPAEMVTMWDNEVAPELMRRAGGSIIVSRTIKTVGIGEGSVDEMISPLLKSTNPSIGVYARADGIHVRIGAKAATQEEAETMIEPVAERLKEILGPAIWGYDEDSFEGVVSRLLDEKQVQLAVMESCTGGGLANVLTNVPGISASFRGGIVSYATDVKELMGVDHAIIAEHSVISPEVAMAMAVAVRERFGADIGIGVTGVAGPDPEDGHPVGEVYIALAGSSRIANDSISLNYPSSRENIKRRAVTQALMLLRRALIAAKPPA